MNNKTKLPWIEHPDIWRNEGAWWNYMRTSLRRAWNRNPVKLTLIKAERKQIPNPNPKGNRPTVFGCTCNYCKKDFPMKNIEVDHIVDAGSLNSIEDMEGFITRLLFISTTDLQLLCKECHAAKTYASKQGVSMEQAFISKKAIQLQKDKLDKDWLNNNGVVPHNNAVGRRLQIEDYLKNKMDKNE